MVIRPIPLLEGPKNSICLYASLTARSSFSLWKCREKFLSIFYFDFYFMAHEFLTSCYDLVFRYLRLLRAE